MFQVLGYTKKNYKMKESSCNTFPFVLLATNLDKRGLMFWRNRFFGESYHFFVIVFDIYCFNQKSKWNHTNNGVQNGTKGDNVIWVIEKDLKIQHFVSMYIMDWD